MWFYVAVSTISTVTTQNIGPETPDARPVTPDTDLHRQMRIAARRDQAAILA